MPATQWLQLASIVVIFVSAASAQPPVKPLTFTADTDSVTNFAPLPAKALELITGDKDDFPHGPPKNLRCVDHESVATSVAWEPEILCRTLPLSSVPGTDYLVIGLGSLRGAHIVSFWIFHQDGRGISLIFKTRSDGITILPTSFTGYREIESTWVKGAGNVIYTNRYRFNGRAYVLSSSREHRN